MPMFDFSCQGCETTFEQLVRTGDIVRCPACNSEHVDKLLSLPSLKTSSTRGLAMQAAKRRDKAQATDRVFEQAKYEATHDD